MVVRTQVPQRDVLVVLTEKRLCFLLYDSKLHRQTPSRARLPCSVDSFLKGRGEACTRTGRSLLHHGRLKTFAIRRSGIAPTHLLP